MNFVPIAKNHDELRKYAPLWLPFLPDIAKRTKEPIESLLDQIGKLQIQVCLIWNDEEKKAEALIGIQYRECGKNVIGEIVWTTGHGMKNWRHLLPQVEQYLKYVGCVSVNPICRPGWAPWLKSQGYKTTHYMMEKVL